MAYGYNPYYPMQDQLAQLRNNPMQYQPYQPTMQPMAQTAAQQTQQVQPSANGINWVQGEEGARAWLVNPNTTVMLMDSDGSSFYLKSADASGMPQPLRIFDYVERTQQPKNAVQSIQVNAADYATREELNALAAKVDALSNKKCSCKDKPQKEIAD